MPLTLEVLVLCMIILIPFLEKLENLAYNDSTLVDLNSNYHGFFVFQKLLCGRATASWPTLRVEN